MSSVHENIRLHETFIDMIFAEFDSASVFLAHQCDIFDSTNKMVDSCIDFLERPLCTRYLDTTAARHQPSCPRGRTSRNRCRHPNVMDFSEKHVPNGYYNEGVFVVGLLFLSIGAVCAFLKWHTKFKHPEKDTFLLFWRHPATRFATSVTSLAVAIYWVCITPTLHGQRYLDLGLLTLTVRFLIADWPVGPPSYLALKCVWTAFTLCASIYIAKTCLHDYVLANKLNLEMFSNGCGTTTVIILSALPISSIGAVAYNLMISAGSTTTAVWPAQNLSPVYKSFFISPRPHPIPSSIPITYETWGRIVAFLTATSAFTTVLAVVDSMLQDTSRYPDFCVKLRTKWPRYRRIVTLAAQASFVVFWGFLVLYDYTSISRRPQDFTVDPYTLYRGGLRFSLPLYNDSSELTRCFITGAAAALTVCTLTQDWEFPSFDNPLELNLLFLSSDKLIEVLQRKCRNAISLLRSWFSKPGSRKLGKRNSGDLGESSPLIDEIDAAQSDVGIFRINAVDEPNHLQGIVPGRKNSIFAVGEHPPLKKISRGRVIQAYGRRTSVISAVTRGVVGFDAVAIDGKWFHFSSLIISLCLTALHVVQVTFYQPLSYGHFLGPQLGTICAVGDVILANLPKKQLAEVAQWPLRFASILSGQDKCYDAQYVGHPLWVLLVAAFIPILMAEAILLECLRKYNRHPDDIARRQRLRAVRRFQKARQKLLIVYHAKAALKARQGGSDTGEVAVCSGADKSHEHGLCEDTALWDPENMNKLPLLTSDNDTNTIPIATENRNISYSLDTTYEESSDGSEIWSGA